MKWFKFYGQDFLTDPKIIGMDPLLKLVWVTLLCLTDHETGTIKHINEYSLLRLAGTDDNTTNDPSDYDRTKGCLETFEKLGMITNDNGTIVITNYKKRQETNLSGYERVKKYREKRKVEAKNNNGMITNDNVINDNTRIDKNRLDKNINNGASPKIKSSGPGTIGEVLSSYEIPHEKESERVKTGWQFRALEWAKDLGIDLNAGTPKQNYRGRWFKVFREADGNRQKNIKLHDAYTNLRDYPKPLKSEEKINMFFFLYNGHSKSSPVTA